MPSFLWLTFSPLFPLNHFPPITSLNPFLFPFPLILVLIIPSLSLPPSILLPPLFPLCSVHFGRNQPLPNHLFLSTLPLFIPFTIPLLIRTNLISSFSLIFSWPFPFLSPLVTPSHLLLLLYSLFSFLSFPPYKLPPLIPLPISSLSLPVILYSAYFTLYPTLPSFLLLIRTDLVSSFSFIFS